MKVGNNVLHIFCHFFSPASIKVISTNVCRMLAADYLKINCLSRCQLRLLFAVLAVSLVFGGGSAPRTGALRVEPLTQCQSDLSSQRSLFVFRDFSHFYFHIRINPQFNHIGFVHASPSSVDPKPCPIPRRYGSAHSVDIFG
jgi:hypothetical protein